MFKLRPARLNITLNPLVIFSVHLTMFNEFNGIYFSVYSKKREVVPELAPMLWHSFGTIAALLQEIINIYPAINPPHLTVSSVCVYMYMCVF